LQTMPGVGELASAAILAETGADMRVFPTPEQIASWAGLCPGKRDSGGISKGGHTTHGNVYLRTALVQCAWAAARKRDSVFQERFRRMAPRLGPKRAIVAVAHSMLTAMHFMLSSESAFRGVGESTNRRRRDRRAHHHLKCLRRLGLNVRVEDPSAVKA
jgi:transposase